MTDGFAAWSVAFTWTLALELPVYARCLRGHRLRWHRPLSATLGLNLATHPLFSWWVLTALPGTAAIAAAELAIAGIEGALLAIATRRVPWRTAMLAAGLANLFSWGLGSLLLR